MTHTDKPRDDSYGSSRKSEESVWEPLPLSNALMGHLIVGAIGAVASLALMGIAQLASLAPPASFQILCGGAVGSWLLISIAGTFIERRFVLARKHDDPGSGLKALLLFLLAIPAGLLAGAIIGAGDGQWVVVATLAVLVGHGLELVFLARPWRDGMTRGEVREAWDKTKTMTAEVFAEEINDAKQHQREKRD